MPSLGYKALQAQASSESHYLTGLYAIFGIDVEAYV